MERICEVQDTRSFKITQHSSAAVVEWPPASTSRAEQVRAGIRKKRLAHAQVKKSSHGTVLTLVMPYLITN